MADTGAPWNLPYPLPTDLVRDGADAIKDLAEAVADGLDDAGSEGIGPNVVQVVRTDVFSASVAVASFSGDALSATITPSSATAKVLVIAQLSPANQFATLGVGIGLFRGGSATDYRGDADGVKSRIATASASGESEQVSTATLVYLDSPGAATAQTYSVRLSHTNGSTTTVYLNRSSDDPNATRISRAASSLTLIEVAA